MRGYYNIHDLTNMQMGFYSIDEAIKPVPIKALSIPITKMPTASRDFIKKKIKDPDHTNYIIAATCVAVVVTVGIIILGIKCFFLII